MDRIHENNCIYFFQGTFLPLFDKGNVFVRNPADCTVRNLDIVKIPHRAFDIRCRHAFGIHGYDYFFHVLCFGILILLDNLRFKLSLTISGIVNLHVPITGMQRFLGIAISAVLSILLFVVILGIAEFFVHLGI